MRLLSQLDKQWAHLPIGKTNLKIGRWGCTITSICMIDSDFYPEYIKPPEAAKQWAFTDQGLILWKSCNFKGFTFEFRGYGNEKRKIKQYALDSDKGVILEVNESHWVAVASWNVANDCPVIHDPLGGIVYNVFPAKYQITGYALFEKTSKEMPAAGFAKPSIKKAIDAQVITDWTNPKGLVDDKKMEWVLYKLGALKERQGSLTLERLAVALDNLKLLDQ